MEIGIWFYFEVWLLLFKYENDRKLCTQFLKQFFSPKISWWPNLLIGEREQNFFSKNSTSCMRWCLWKFESFRNLFCLTCAHTHVYVESRNWRGRLWCSKHKKLGARTVRGQRKSRYHPSRLQGIFSVDPWILKINEINLLVHKLI